MAELYELWGLSHTHHLIPPRANELVKRENQALGHLLRALLLNRARQDGTWSCQPIERFQEYAPYLYP